MIKKAFNIEDLWTWFLRIIMGLLSFLLVEAYQDIKAMSKDVGEIKLIVATSQKDIEYLKDDQKSFKEETKGRLTYLERNKK